jgi:hypothetical protein
MTLRSIFSGRTMRPHAMIVKPQKADFAAKPPVPKAPAAD